MGLFSAPFLLTHNQTHTGKNCVETADRIGWECASKWAEKGQRLPEITLWTAYALFVISRSGVQVRSPAPQVAAAQDKLGCLTPNNFISMGEFPSGQRGQTVNLLAPPSVVRIHSPPPLKNRMLVRFVVFYADFLLGAVWMVLGCCMMIFEAGVTCQLLRWTSK